MEFVDLKQTHLNIMSCIEGWTTITDSSNDLN